MWKSLTLALAAAAASSLAAAPVAEAGTLDERELKCELAETAVYKNLGNRPVQVTVAVANGCSGGATVVGPDGNSIMTKSNVPVGGGVETWTFTVERRQEILIISSETEAGPNNLVYQVIVE
jgi:hypothetical protein